MPAIVEPDAESGLNWLIRAIHNDRNDVKLVVFLKKWPDKVTLNVRQFRPGEMLTSTVSDLSGVAR